MGLVHGGTYAALAETMASWATVVAVGPVADPADTGGLAVVEAGTANDVRALGAADPPVTSRLSTFEVYAMPGAIMRPREPAGPSR